MKTDSNDDSVRNLAAQPVQVTRVDIIDALGARIESRADRGELVDGTRDTERRYQQSGKLVRAGAGGGWVIAGGVAGAAAGGALLAAGLTGTVVTGAGFAMAVPRRRSCGGGGAIGGSGCAALCRCGCPSAGAGCEGR